MVTQVATGDLFESKAQTLVNTVNCIGVMGKGIALEFKRRFPEMFKDYVARCERNDVEVGKPYLYKSLAEPWIINFPTKEHWRSTSRIKDIVKGLEYVAKHYREWGIKSLAVPPLGCGQGKLDWKSVGPVLYHNLNALDIPIELYAPHGTPKEQTDPQFLASRAEEMVSSKQAMSSKPVKAAWVALVEILNRIEREPYHWPVGRVVFQKITYVATQEGLPTGLRFSKGSYGPFSPELKDLITSLVNEGLIQEKRLGRMLPVEVGPAFEEHRDKHLDEIAKWENTIKKVADLFMRMHTHRSEIVATVLFAANTLANDCDHKPAEYDVLKDVMEWKQSRRPPLDTGEVAYTIRNLAALGWLNVNPSPDLPIPEEKLVDA